MPKDFVPIEGSSGEKWRERTLMYQVPKQDISKEFCKYLGDIISMKKYQKYIDNRNNRALDVAICLKNTYKDLVNFYLLEVLFLFKINLSLIRK